MRRSWRPELILPATIVVAAVALGISELMTTFQLTPPGGDPLRDQLAADRHGYAMLLLAAFALTATGIAIVGGLRAAAWATAGFGVAALALFLIIDLPDAGQLGEVGGPAVGLVTVKAEPQPGFWLEATATVLLALASVAFATLDPEQLRAPRRSVENRRRRLEQSPPGAEARGKPIDS